MMRLESLLFLLSYSSVFMFMNLQLFVIVFSYESVSSQSMSEIVLFVLCRFIYTGSVQVTSEIAQDVLRAADQYLLEGLKRLCEYTIAKVSKKATL